MSGPLEGSAFFRDPVHGPIRFGEPASSIIDTYEVQRLQYIRQLSTVYLVHRSANHTRFEHSIGVAHLAGQAIRNLQLAKDLPEGVTLSAEDRMIVEIAGIVHDAGHGPFGHVTESVLAWSGVEPNDHETFTRAVINGEFQEEDGEQIRRYPGGKSLLSKLDAIMENLGITTQELAYLATGRFHPKKDFMAQLISSPTDVDRLDFLARDTYFVGLGRGIIDIDTVAGALTVVTTESGPERPWPANELAVDIQALAAIEATLAVRDHMYAEVYSLPINRAAQAMLLRATKRLLDGNKISYKEFVRLTDHSLLLMLRSEGDDYCRDVAWRIENRRILQRVPELEYTYYDLETAQKWDEFVRYIDNPRKNVDLENEFASRMNPRPADGEIIVDLPHPKRARFVEADAKIRTRGSARSLVEVSPLVRFINETALRRRWRMMVFVPFSQQDPRYSLLVKEFRERFGLGEPSEYPRLVRSPENE